MLVVDQPLKTPQAPLGIISLQLAGTTPAARLIIRNWDSKQRLNAAFGLGLDVLFFLVYAAWLYMGCRWAAERWTVAGSAYGKLLSILSVCPILAALLDGVEDVILLWFLQSDGRSPFYPIAYGCAVLKFLMIISAVVVWMAGIRPPVAKPASAPPAKK